MIPIGDTRRSPVAPMGVYILIALNVIVFIREAAGPDTDAFINSFASIPYDVTHGVVLPSPSPPWAPLTLVTSQFLHASVLHIFFNMLFLFVFGPDVEYLCGTIRFVIFYLLCGAIGGLVQVFMGPGSHVPTLGASGAIAGVLGAYIVSFPTHSIRAIIPIGCFPLFLSLPAILVIGVWAAIQFVTGFGSVSSHMAAEQSGGIAYFAHIGGFLAGLFLIFVFRIRTPGDAERRFRYYYR